MKSFWSECLAYLQTAWEYVQTMPAWTELHQGLGGWLGAIGAVVAIFVTWGLSRAEYQRERRREREKKNREIDLLKVIVGDFDAVMRDYYVRLAGEDPLIANFYSRIMNSPEVHSMSDLAHMPVTQWPSFEAYVSFKNYWFLALKDMESPLQDSKLAEFRLSKYEPRIAQLVTSLDEARRS